MNPFIPSGWMTKLFAVPAALVGLAGILTGLAGLIAHFTEPTSNLAMDVDTAVLAMKNGVLAISAAGIAWGLGRKADANTAAVKENTEVSKVNAATVTPVVIVPPSQINTVQPPPPPVVPPVDPIAALVSNFSIQLAEAGNDPEKLKAIGLRLAGATTTTLAPTPPIV